MFMDTLTLLLIGLIFPMIPAKQHDSVYFKQWPCHADVPHL